MACEPPVSGSRVSAIKSQFENLSHLDSETRPVVVPKAFAFRRAATMLEMKSPEKEKLKISGKSWAGRELAKQCSDSAILKYASRKTDPAPTRVKQPKLIDSEPVESRFMRHTIDPVKRSSIKRSPAFRIGDKQNKAMLVKQISVEPKEFEDFVVKTCPNDLERLQQPGMTDSIRSALRQPLPHGPPPKKPPRMFGSPTNSSTPSDADDTCEMREKIAILENRLDLTKQLSAANNLQNKSKTEQTTTLTLLDCLSCHRNASGVYDSIVTPMVDDERKPLMQSNVNVVKRFSNTVKPEPIYMEPFSHLKNRPRCCEKIEEEPAAAAAVSQMDCSTGSSSNMSRDDASLCSLCPEHHDKSSDTHYLCTAIDDNIEGSDTTIPSCNEGNVSLGKTYDEITILVDAAFKQKSANSMGNRNSEEFQTKGSTKLTRTLTEKRKDYVRRISVIPDKRIQTYGTLHRTFKSPVIRTFSLEDEDIDTTSEMQLESLDNSEALVSTSERIDKYKKLIEKNQSPPASNIINNNNNNIKLRPKRVLNKVAFDELKNDVDLDDDAEVNGPKLFQVCLLVGYNVSTNSAYLKSKFPADEAIPDNIEQLIFPNAKMIRSGKENQEYCLILTDHTGFKIYGYCRRVLPENSDVCLPLCYCIISVKKALGFYQKLLKEIESRHGQSDTQMNFLFRNLQRAEIPMAGKYLHIKLPMFNRPKEFFSSSHKISPKRLSLEANPKWLNVPSQQDVSENRRKTKSLLQEFEEKKQQQPFDLGLINRSLIVRDPRFDEILIRRPSDLRLENTELSELLMCMGSELLLNVFSTLLLERKVILQSTNISLLTKSILALQTILYPFQWQYTIITILPSSMTDVCQAPFPVLVGVLEDIPFEIEDGIVVDLNTKRIVQTCGDESTIIPDSLRDSLKLSLEMVDLIDQGKMLSSVLISEAFLRYFIELIGNYRKPYYHKEEFIQNHQSQNIKFFLEWFVETSMFRHFVHDRYPTAGDSLSTDRGVSDDFYKLFDARFVEKSDKNSKNIENIETIVKNSKIINRKGKTFKERFKDLF